MDIPKILALYFPQFHAINENDEWWGKDFTDWKLVKEAKPLFEGHSQPRVPLEGHYYDPTKETTLLKQAELARKYGIEGFVFYHYWFDGKLLLEKPLEVFLSNKDIDIKFCVAWANESWTRAWIGKPEAILQKQLHKTDREMWEKHFNYLLPFFKDSRAIKINDKPVFLIYQPFLISGSQQMIDLWQKMAVDNGLDGLFVIAIKTHEYQSTDFLTAYDGLMKFQPREAYTSKEFQNQNVQARFQFLRRLPRIMQLYLSKFYQRISTYKIFDSTRLWEIILKNAFDNPFKTFDLKIFETAFFEWDNTARYKEKAKIFTGLSDADKKDKLMQLMTRACENNSPYVFFNAWNEWSEAAYLEPDNANGYRNLEIIRTVVDELKNLQGNVSTVNC